MTGKASRYASNPLAAARAATMSPAARAASPASTRALAAATSGLSQDAPSARREAHSPWPTPAVLGGPSCSFLADWKSCLGATLPWVASGPRWLRQLRSSATGSDPVRDSAAPSVPVRLPVDRSNPTLAANSFELLTAIPRGSPVEPFDAYGPTRGPPSRTTSTRSAPPSGYGRDDGCSRLGGLR